MSSQQQKNLYLPYQKMTDIICTAGFEWCVFKRARNWYKFGYSNNLGVPTLGVYFRGQL